MVNVTSFVSKLFPITAPIVGNNPYAVGTEEPFGIENRVFPEELDESLNQDPAAFLTPPVRETEHDDSDSDSSSQITLSSDEDESNDRMMYSLVYPDMSADFDAEVVEEHADLPHPTITLYRGSRPSNSEDDADDELLINVEEEEEEDDAPHPNFTLFRGSRAFEMNDSDEEVFADREDNSDSDEEDADANDVTESIRPFARVSFSDEEQKATTPSNPSPTNNHVNVIPYESSDYEPEYNYDDEEEEEEEPIVDYQVFHPTPCMICEEHVVYQNVYENSCCENIFCRDCLMGYARTHLIHGSKIVCPKCRISIDIVKRH
jgi:hypothetical protein